MELYSISAKKNGRLIVAHKVLEETDAYYIVETPWGAKWRVTKRYMRIQGDKCYTTINAAIEAKKRAYLEQIRKANNEIAKLQARLREYVEILQQWENGEYKVVDGTNKPI